MECPNCKKEIEDWRAECPNCKINIEKYNEGKRQQFNKVENATFLNIFAYIDIIVSIIGTILIWINYSISDITKEINIIGIATGLAVLIGGFTLFFLLKTIVDICWRLER